MDQLPHVRPITLVAILLGLVLPAAWADKPLAPTATGDPALQALQWRLIGPFRGGRVDAVAGIPGDLGVFYMGPPTAASGRPPMPATTGPTSATAAWTRARWGPW